ncbi:hypothetical protein L2E82_44449 [Cichorium intybus]|uniref:Uncharacterized protein n=1 Tax=Cichorium intybus TaxID=13427 RepID=A0ACB8ZRL4_CICIN|nr:hypothetical protein L2E82_44449 [Cichorium intybus]
MIAKHSKPSSRKTRTKRRKPKYLRLQLIANHQPPMPTTTADDDHDNKQLINLFPLHPENLVEQDKVDEEHSMACIFSSCDDDGAATTLTGILCSDDEDEEVEAENTNNPSPSSVNYVDEEVELIRTAMRRNKTDRHHEKWVCYSEVVEKKKVTRGMSSSSSSTSCNHNHSDNNHRSKLVLKLDYGKVMDSWVNKGPLYIHKNSDPGTPQPQTVPDLQDDDFFFPSSINPLHGMTHDELDNACNGGSWTVPEMTNIENTDINTREDALQVVGSSAMIQHREASVQRYKEKRRNRLFAKTIRYEVRKLNAEKRPRIKGRFVKRN